MTDRAAAEKVVREMVQAKLLGRIFAFALKGELALKGGMAMRVSTGSARLTKDIDLMASPAASIPRIEGRIKAALKELNASGLVRDLTISQPKRTETTLRWKIGGAVGDTTMNLTVEISRRSPLPEGHVRSVTWTPPADYNLTSILVDCLDPPMLAASKVGCLASPRREAVRDVFDLHLLIVNEARPPMEALRSFGCEVLQRAIDGLWDKLEKMDFQRVQSELLPFLEPGLASRIDAARWDEMLLLVGQRTEAWLREALEDDAPVLDGPEP